MRGATVEVESSIAYRRGWLDRKSTEDLGLEFEALVIDKNNQSKKHGLSFPVHFAIKHFLLGELGNTLNGAPGVAVVPSSSWNAFGALKITACFGASLPGDLWPELGHRLSPGIPIPGIFGGNRKPCFGGGEWWGV